jgi:hypothetical protein
VVVKEVVVVHDAACGACAAVVRDLPQLLRVPVRVRSCRDPELHAAHLDLPVAVRACRTPAIGLLRPDGTVRWYPGLRAAPALLRVLRPRSLHRGARVLLTVRRTSRARAADRR